MLVEKGADVNAQGGRYGNALQAASSGGHKETAQMLVEKGADVNLGNLHEHQGRLSDAEAMYERALRGYEKALGPEHTSTLDTVNNLGRLYADQDRLSDAEAMYERALRGYEKALGQEHVDFYIPALNRTRNLAVLYTQMHNVSKARVLYMRCQGGVKAVFGVQHEQQYRTRSRDFEIRRQLYYVHKD